jgi:hypothetical protein
MMGTQKAIEMAEAVEEGLPLAAALEYHLTSNHYPPLPRTLVQTAMKAILLVNHGQDMLTVRLPRGVELRGYGQRVPAWKLVDAMHLGAFIDTFIDGDYDRDDDGNV